MKIKEITVHAGRTFNHPYESFSNLRPSITLSADIFEGEDPEEAAKELQAKAEGLVEDHKRNMLASLDEIHELETSTREIKSLEDQLKHTQSRLDEIRSSNPHLLQSTTLPEET